MKINGRELQMHYVHLKEYKERIKKETDPKMKKFWIYLYNRQKEWIKMYE